MKAKIKNWELVQLISKGRWSNIYSARPRKGGTDSADYVVKIVEAKKSDREMAIEMLKREYACSELVKHPGLISFLDHSFQSPEDSTPFLVSARILGDSLLAINRRLRQVIDLNEKLMFFRQVSEALREMHQNKIRHGDVSPGNIIIDLKEGSATLIDLGLATRIDHFACCEHWQAGTPGYIAPECGHAKDPIVASSDVFSLGKSMVEFFRIDERPGANASATTGFIYHKLESLLNQMTRLHPLRRPTIHEVINVISELEIFSLEGVEFLAA